MERLKQIFNDRFDINYINMSKKQQDVVITVWAEHFKKVKPASVCLGTFRGICRSLYNEYKLYLSNKEMLVEKLEKLEKQKKKTKKSKKK